MHPFVNKHVEYWREQDWIVLICQMITSMWTRWKIIHVQDFILTEAKTMPLPFTSPLLFFHPHFIIPLRSLPCPFSLAFSLFFPFPLQFSFSLFPIFLPCSPLRGSTHLIQLDGLWERCKLLHAAGPGRARSTKWFLDTFWAEKSASGDNNPVEVFCETSCRLPTPGLKFMQRNKKIC